MVAELELELDHPTSQLAVLYRADEVLACWRRIEAPLLWVEGGATDFARLWGGRFSRAEVEARMRALPPFERATIADAGHMLHHDQPERLAAIVERFLDAPLPPADPPAAAGSGAA